MTQPNDLDIPVPRNREAEEAVLGAALQSLAAFKDAARLLSTSDFYDPANELIWEMLTALAESCEVIDPMLVMQEMAKAGTLNRAGGAPRLADLIGNPLAGTNVTYYAQLVRNASRGRRLLQVHQRIGQALIDNIDDPDQLLSRAATISLDLEVLIEERDDARPVDGLSSWSEAWQRYPMTTPDWLIADFLLSEDVMLLLAGEGVGKSWFTRQICLAAMSGVHPFHPERRIEPIRTLLVDLENAPSMVAYESRLIGTQVARLGHWDDDMGRIWLKEDGLDLRKRPDAMLLERVIAETRPQLVGLGSLYKAFQRGKDDWDTAASETREVLDKLRRRYKCAFLLEHHQPKGQGAHPERPSTPYGSSEWMRWCSLGFILNRVGENMYSFDPFRGTRMKRHIPLGLVQGGELPWTPVWDQTELENCMWEKPKGRGGH